MRASARPSPAAVLERRQDRHDQAQARPEWSDGKPVVAEDVIFYLDLLKAALKRFTESTGASTRRVSLPDNIASWTARGAHTVVLHLAHAVNPNWFTDQPAAGRRAPGSIRLPSQDWNVDSAQGEHITDWATNPADALKIYDYLHSQGSARSTFASSPLWKVVDGPFRLKYFSASSGAYDLVPNATLRAQAEGPRRAPSRSSPTAAPQPMLHALRVRLRSRSARSTRARSSDRSAS